MQPSFSLVPLLILLWAHAGTCADYVLNEQSQRLGVKLSIEQFGTIRECPFRLGRTFKITGKLPGKSCEQLVSNETTYRVYDGRHQLLAAIVKTEAAEALELAVVRKQAVISLSHLLGNTYTISAPDKVRLAQGSSNPEAHTITVTEPNGAISTLTHSGGRLYQWRIHQPEASRLDPRVLWILAATKTASDRS